MTERRENDAYPTPGWASRRFFEVVEPPGVRWLEPASGAGGLIREARNFFPEAVWYAIDIDDRYRERLRGLASRFRVGDFLEVSETIRPGQFDAVIGNPPFSHALQFARRCVELVDWTALLLRLAFLESRKRCDWLRDHTPSVYVLPNRPSFDGSGGSDRWAYAWFVWSSEKPTVQILEHTPLHERT